MLSKIRYYFVKFKRDDMLIYCIRAIDVLAIPHYTTDVLANCYEYPYHVISIKHRWDEFFERLRKAISCLVVLISSEYSLFTEWLSLLVLFEHEYFVCASFTRSLFL